MVRPVPLPPIALGVNPMPYSEKLLNVSDLLSAWQNRAMREGGQAEQDARQKLMEQQLESGRIANEAAKWNLQKEKDAATASVVPDKTAGMLTGEFGNFLSTRQPLSQMPMYVSGTSPEAYQAQQFALRQALASGRGWGGGGGGQTQEQADLLSAQTDLTEEKARQAQQERQGYGSATRDLIAQDTLKQQAANAEANRQNQMDIAKIYSGAKTDVANIEAASDIMGDVAKSNAKAAGEIGKYYSGDTAYKGMNPELQKKTIEFYNELINSREFQRTIPAVQNNILKNLPAFIAGNSSDLPDVTDFMRNAKAQYNDNYLKALGYAK